MEVVPGVWNILPRCKMLEEVAKEYAQYMSNLDIQGEVKTVQDIIDNMITRLEELTSVLQMIKSKNQACSVSIKEDITRYRAEVSVLLWKKINVLTEVLTTLINNVNSLEKYVEKAEADFGINADNKFKSFLKPFLKKKEQESSLPAMTLDTYNFQSVLGNFTTQISE